MDESNGYDEAPLVGYKDEKGDSEELALGFIKGIDDCGVLS